MGMCGLCALSLGISANASLVPRAKSSSITSGSPSRTASSASAPRTRFGADGDVLLVRKVGTNGATERGAVVDNENADY